MCGQGYGPANVVPQAVKEANEALSGAENWVCLGVLKNEPSTSDLLKATNVKKVISYLF